MEYAMCAEGSVTLIEKPNFKNVKYGQLVEAINDKGYHSGMKIHFFNDKGVLIGNVYEFVSYDKIRFKSEKHIWEQKYLNQRFEKLKQFFYELTCKIITVLIRKTQTGL